MPKRTGKLSVVAQPPPVAGLAGAAAAGIEGPAVNGKEADLRIFPEGGLRPIAVMNVPVDDQHAVEPQLGDRRPGRHRHVVQQTKPHGAVGQGMVARRADQAKRLAVLAADDALGGVANARHRLLRHVIRRRADDRVAFDVAAARLGKRPKLVEVGRRVHPRQPPPIARAELRPAALPVQPRLH